MPPVISMQEVLGVGGMAMQDAAAGAVGGGGGFGDPILKQIHNELKTHTKLLTEIRDALRKATGATAGGVGAMGALGGAGDWWRGGGLMAMGGRAGALGRFGAAGLGAAGGWYASGMAESNWGRLGAGVAGGALSGGAFGLATGGPAGAAAGAGLGALGGAVGAMARWETKTEEATAKGMAKGLKALVQENKTGAIVGALTGIGGGVSSMFMGGLGGALGQQTARQMGGGPLAEAAGSVLGPGLFGQYAGMAESRYQQALAYRGAVSQARLAGGGGVFGAQGSRYFGPTALAGMAPGMVGAGGNIPGMTRETAGLGLMMQLTRNVGVGETMGAASGMLMRGGAAGLNPQAQQQVLKSILADAVSAGFERQIGRYGAAVGQAMDEATRGLMTTSEDALGATEEMGEAIRQLSRRYDIRPENAAQIAASGRAMFGQFGNFMQTGGGQSPFQGAMMYRTLAGPAAQLAGAMGVPGASLSAAGALGSLLGRSDRGAMQMMGNILQGAPGAAGAYQSFSPRRMREEIYGRIQAQARGMGGEAGVRFLTEQGGLLGNVQDKGMQFGLAARMMRGGESPEKILGEIKEASKSEETILKEFKDSAVDQLRQMGGPLAEIRDYEAKQLDIAMNMLPLSRQLVALNLQSTAMMTAWANKMGVTGAAVSAIESMRGAMSRIEGGYTAERGGVRKMNYADMAKEVARALGLEIDKVKAPPSGGSGTGGSRFGDVSPAQPRDPTPVERAWADKMRGRTPAERAAARAERRRAAGTAPAPPGQGLRGPGK